MKSICFNYRYLILFAITLAVEIVIAVFVRDRFIRPYGGDVLAVVLVYAALRTLWNNDGVVPVIVTFVIACGVEAAQYLNVFGFLRGVAPLRIATGATFDLVDIACYGAGSVVIFFALRKLPPPSNRRG